MDPMMNDRLLHIERELHDISLSLEHQNMLSEYSVLRDLLPPGRPAMKRYRELEQKLWPST